MRFTKIAGRSIPVLLRHGQTEVYFEGGAHGEGVEHGWFAFWTVVGEDEYGGWAIIGRCYSHLPAGNRFRRIKRERHDAKTVEDRKAYAAIYRNLKTAWYVRPATVREVQRWMRSHESDYFWENDPLVWEGSDIELRGLRNLM